MLLISWIILFALGVASLYLPFVHWYYWRGFWRVLALVPLLLPLGYVATVIPRLFAEQPDHSIDGTLFFALVATSFVLSIGLRAWHGRADGSDIRREGKD